MNNHDQIFYTIINKKENFNIEKTIKKDCYIYSNNDLIKDEKKEGTHKIVLSKFKIKIQDNKIELCFPGTKPILGPNSVPGLDKVIDVIEILGLYKDDIYIKKNKENIPGYEGSRYNLDLFKNSIDNEDLESLKRIEEQIKTEIIQKNIFFTVKRDADNKTVFINKKDKTEDLMKVLIEKFNNKKDLLNKYEGLDKENPKKVDFARIYKIIDDKTISEYEKLERIEMTLGEYNIYISCEDLVLDCLNKDKIETIINDAKENNGFYNYINKTFFSFILYNIL